MKALHFAIGYRSKSTAKAPAQAHVKYITRTAEHDAAAHAAYVTRTTQHMREDLVATGAGNLPAWANTDPIAFFAAADQWERSNGRTATQITAALPRELTQAQQRQAVESFIVSQLGTQHAYVWGMHQTVASDGGAYPHVHIAFSERKDTGRDLLPSRYFARDGYTKDLHFNAKDWPRAARQAWSDTLNVALEQAGVAARVSARSFQDQGLDVDAAGYIAPTRNKAHEAAIRQRVSTEDTPGMHARRAAEWEARKQELGLTQRMRREEIAQRIGDASRGYVQAQHRQRQESAVSADEAPRIIQQLAQTEARLGAVQRVKGDEVQYVQQPERLRSMEHLVAVQRALEGEEEGASWSRFRPRREHDRDDIRQRGRGWSR